MTKQELNRDIKRLKARHLKAIEKEFDQKAIDEIEEMNKEFRHLYDEDRIFENVTKQNILFMIRYNIIRRVIPFHQFGLYIEIEKL